MPDVEHADLGGEAACWADQIEAEVESGLVGNLQYHLPAEVRRRMERLRQELGDAGVVVPTIEESVLLREIDLRSAALIETDDVTVQPLPTGATVAGTL